MAERSARRGAGPRAARARALAALGAALGALLVARPARAWLFFEHDAIGGRGIARLDAADRATLEAAWRLGVARPGRTRGRYCDRFGQTLSRDSVRDARDWCVGFPALPAIAGDHACVPDEMVRAVDASAWLGAVLYESRARGEALVRYGRRDRRRVNQWREHNLALQNADPELVSRAENNLSHFLLPLEAGPAAATAGGGGGDLARYLARALAAGAPPNAVASYANYHALALRAALEAAPGCAAAPDAALRCTPAAAARAWDALVAEAFALHFLEDAFSAGHFVGTWGDVGQRLGTHDYYSERGIDARTWAGDFYAANGDAFMNAADAEHAAGAVRASLSQLARALRAGGAGEDAAGLAGVGASAPRPGLSVCARGTGVPAGLAALAGATFLQDVVRQAPTPPSRDFGPPRFRSEIGLFVGLSVEGTGVALVGEGPRLAYSDARFRVGLGFGVALEGAFSRYMDGRLYVDLLLAASMHEYTVGRRSVGFGLRVRMPFSVLPGDLLYLTLPATLLRREWGFELAQLAIAGGVGRLQRQLIFPGGTSLQFVLGRELVAVWFPEVGWQFDLPVLEVSGERLFTGAFATDPVFQIGASANLRENAQSFGLFVGFAERIRRYIPQACGDDC